MTTSQKQLILYAIAIILTAVGTGMGVPILINQQSTILMLLGFLWAILSTAYIISCLFSIAKILTTKAK